MNPVARSAGPACAAAVTLGAVLLAGWLLSGGCTTYVDAHLDLRILPEAADIAEADWVLPYPGIRYARFTHAEPPVAVTIMIVDLDTLGLEPTVSPSVSAPPHAQTVHSRGIPPDAETMGMKTSAFIEVSGSVAAFNASPFAPVGSREGTGKDVSGLHIYEGDLVSPPARGMDALYLLRDGRAMVGPQVPYPVPISQIRHAAGGFTIIVRRGEVGGTDGSRHPRTAVGIGDEGRTLIILTADGRQRNHSIGLTTHEVGCWLAAFGADDGINLDGGGSTALALRTEDGGVLLLNSPIHGGMPGRERPVANHVGIRFR